MDHGPNITTGKDYAPEYKSRLGLRLFLVYSILYAGFIIINAFIPRLMAFILFAGLNLAVVYGFGLIITAIVLGLIYNHLCTKKEQQMQAAESAGGQKP
ncbi:MAG: DUF485 domain-containing protein [Spirochaetes bacterium]|nr:DUF485 domain-containing protein [Spirochaetota bacterium]